MPNQMDKRYTCAECEAMVLVTKAGGYTVSVRAPVSNPQGADELCSRFESGGGRKGAAGINLLPHADFDVFVDAFRAAFS